MTELLYCSELYISVEISGVCKDFINDCSIRNQYSSLHFYFSNIIDNFLHNFPVHIAILGRSIYSHCVTFLTRTPLS